MSFDEWFYKQLGDRDETQQPFKIVQMWAVGAYKAGAASRQEVIDSLNNQIDALYVEIERIQKEYQMMFEGVQGRQQTIDELQKRIDEALRELMVYKNISVACEILKGDCCDKELNHESE